MTIFSVPVHSSVGSFPLFRLLSVYKYLISNSCVGVSGHRHVAGECMLHTCQRCQLHHFIFRFLHYLISRSLLWQFFWVDGESRHHSEDEQRWNEAIRTCSIVGGFRCETKNVSFVNGGVSFANAGVYITEEGVIELAGTESVVRLYIRWLDLDGVCDAEDGEIVTHELGALTDGDRLGVTNVRIDPDVEVRLPYRLGRY